MCGGPDWKISLYHDIETLKKSSSLSTLQSLEQSKNCVEEDNDGDVLKQETQDLAGLLSSPDTKTRDNGTPSNIKSELNSGSNNDIKEEIKEEISVKNEPGNPGSVGKMPNGDANPGQWTSPMTCLLWQYVCIEIIFLYN